MTEFSRIGSKIASRSGILELMDDLGRALTADPEMRMMGGGQPASIPEVNAVWRRRMEEILSEPGAFDRMLVNYDPPAGSPPFRSAVARLFRREFGWDISDENVAVTAGGQTAFFFLFNLLGGEMSDRSRRRILLPLVPEYIGYANQGASENLFHACRPRIELLGDRAFKYRVDFDAVEAALEREKFAAVCVSRPTNPSGNVLTDDEIRRLADLCAARGIFLMVDSAYGAPFPGILFKDVTPIWNEHVILTLSLSKIGLPGARTAIVIARPEIANAVAACTSVVGLSNGTIGQAIARPLLESGELLDLSRRVVRPFYEEKSKQAAAWFREFFPADLPCRVHESEGALFLWLWFRDLPLTSLQLYQRLKERKVLVVPGEFFFYGLDEPWLHENECLRITFSQPENVVREGLEILGDEVARAYA